MYLSTTLCIAQQNRSIGVNVVREGSPSRILSVRRISLGITIRPKSSTLLTMPVAFIYLSPFLLGTKPPLCKGRWLPVGQTEGLSLSTHHNPPVSSADSPLYTRGPFPIPYNHFTASLTFSRRYSMVKKKCRRKSQC